MKEKQDSVSFVKERADEGTNWAILRQIMINRAFYSSQQWISWDRTQKRVYVPDLRPGEKRMTFNKLRPAILTLLSKLSKNRVKLEVKPDTNDTERIEVAKAGLKYLHYQWDADKMDTKSRRLKLLMLTDGFPALKVFVDKNKGDDIPNTEELPEGVEQAPKKTGKICTLVCDQFAVKVDPNAEDVTEIKWAVEERPTDVDEIREQYGKEVQPESIEQRNSYEFGAITDKPRKYSNHAMVRDYWEWPCVKYPKGRRIVTAGDQELLREETDPGENPYIFFPALPIPGRAVADAVVTDLTTPQRSYNIKRTAEARILEEMGNPMWLNPGTDDEELVNEIGGIIHYTPNETLKPERVSGIEPGAGWQNAMERDEADMEDISGAHEISQGATPRGNNTLGGLQLQVEQDETKLALLVQSYEDGIKIWGEKVLRLVQKYFPEEQQLTIVGETGEIEAFTFVGADLTGSEVVDVVPGSSMPTLKAVQDEKVLAMWGAGMFTDPKTGQPDTRRVVRMLGESIASQYFDDTEQDENKALMEVRQWQQAFEDPMMLQQIQQYMAQLQAYQVTAQQAAMVGVAPEQAGLMPPQPVQGLPIVRDFYDHEVHLMVHNRFRKTREYDELDPMLQQIVDSHCDEHMQYIMAPQIQAQQQQMMMQQQQTEQQAQEADKAHQRQMDMKAMDLQARADSEALKANTALQTAAMRQPTGVR
jgi:hypothetical protein